MTTAKKTKLPTKKAIADAKREARAAQQAADFEKSKAAMTPQNREDFEKVIAAKNKPKPTAIGAPKVALSATLTSKYESVYEVQKVLGDVDEIKRVFVEFQQHLYNVKFG